MKHFLLVLLIASTKFTFSQTPPAHTVILVLENKSYSQVIGNSTAPYLNGLVNNVHTALLTQSYGLTHPSQPNYIMLFSGSNQGVTDNDLPKGTPFTTLNFGASLINKGYSFIGFSEDLSFVGSNVSVNNGYARKHNPWVNWQNASTNGIPAASNRPFTDFPTDYNNLPAVSFVIPNIYNDMHDGSIAVGDNWIRDNLGGYINWCVNNNSLFILTFDEDDNLENNRIPTFFHGANVRGGTINQKVDHYNVLRTLEDLYQLPHAGISNDSSAIKGLWLTALPVRLKNLTASLLSNKVHVSWQTVQEENAKEFVVERSVDNGRTFESIGSITAKGTNNNSYKFVDENLKSENSYYRLKQVDKDNKYQYSSSALIVYKAKTKTFYSVYPNPTKSFAYINTTHSNSHAITVQVINADGKIVKQQLTNIDKRSAAKLNLQGLKAGTYFIKILSFGDTHSSSIAIQ